MAESTPSGKLQPGIRTRLESVKQIATQIARTKTQRELKEKIDQLIADLDQVISEIHDSSTRMPVTKRNDPKSR